MQNIQNYDRWEIYHLNGRRFKSGLIFSLNLYSIFYLNLGGAHGKFYIKLINQASGFKLVIIWWAASLRLMPLPFVFDPSRNFSISLLQRVLLKKLFL